MKRSLRESGQLKPVRYCCPDCGARLIRRTSQVVHPLLQNIILVCQSAACGATFHGVSEITHRLSRPSSQNPAISLPFSSASTRAAIRKTEGLPAVEANGTACGDDE